MKNHLELFSGTHSFGKISKKHNYTVYSLDKELEGNCPLKSDYKSENHYKIDILDFDYKQYPKDFFELISASPPCYVWSTLRNCWIGRKLKAHGDKVITKEILQEDIDKIGKPIVDKTIEIIKYFNPKYYIIENPDRSKMKHYMKEKYPEYDKYYIIDYCKYSNFGYQKRTRFWTNIEGFTPKLCKKDCKNILDNTKEKTQKLHKDRMGTSKTIIDNGKIIRVNTAKLREKYKDFDNIQIKNKKPLHKYDLGSWGKVGTDQRGVGCGSNRYERFRIPFKLINELLLCCY